jgi:AmmeMemoRadiSam system protein A
MEPGFLTEQDQQDLLRIARESLEIYLRGQDPRPIRSELPNLLHPVGAFVSLHKQGELRGCIGHLISDLPLFETVKRMAIAAATQDYRFSPLRADEITSIDIEISVLSPFREMKNLQEIHVGRHGLLITQGQRRGLLLPQVATEYGWTREEFLSHTCLKAGLPPDAWMSESAKIEIFSAQVFGEKQQNHRQ